MGNDSAWAGEFDPESTVKEPTLQQKTFLLALVTTFPETGKEFWKDEFREDDWFCRIAVTFAMNGVHRERVGFRRPVEDVTFNAFYFGIPEPKVNVETKVSFKTIEWLLEKLGTPRNYPAARLDNLVGTWMVDAEPGMLHRLAVTASALWAFADFHDCYIDREEVPFKILLNLRLDRQEVMFSGWDSICTLAREKGYKLQASGAEAMICEDVPSGPDKRYFHRNNALFMKSFVENLYPSSEAQAELLLERASRISDVESMTVMFESPHFVQCLAQMWHREDLGAMLHGIMNSASTEKVIPILANTLAQKDPDTYRRLMASELPFCFDTDDERVKFMKKPPAKKRTRE